MKRFVSLILSVCFLFSINTVSYAANIRSSHQAVHPQEKHSYTFRADRWLLYAQRSTHCRCY